MTTPPTVPTPSLSVLLEHTLPDGSSHFDWLIDRPHNPSPTDPNRGNPEHRMITFRCTIDPFDCETHPWTGTRLPDHRARYIDYEGPISGDRGRVRRLWRTPCVLVEESPSRIRALMHDPRAAQSVAREITLTVPIDESDECWELTISSPPGAPA